MKASYNFKIADISKRRFSFVSYKNGKDILPPELLKEVQKYIDGELIYIPKGSSERAGWGVINGTRDILKGRNSEIYTCYKSGLPIELIIQKYHLSEDSIRRIVSKTNNRSEGVED